MAFIIKPLVTEKMTKITDKQPNRYGFVVRPEANKLEIKKEVESLYNVTVVDVLFVTLASALPVIQRLVLLRVRRMRSRRQSLLLRRAIQLIFTAIFKIKNGST